ncbi:MAG: hypothetical protein AAFX80_21780 [Cyanobacteria bacterium J06639_18]
MGELEQKYDELPLQELFTKLREAGLPLGIDEYQLVLQSLQAGFGISDKAALKRLCEILWVKSTKEKLVLEYHFEQLIGSEEFISGLKKGSENPNKSKLRKIYLIIRYVIFFILEIVIVFSMGTCQKQQADTKVLPPVPPEEPEIILPDGGGSPPGPKPVPPSPVQSNNSTPLVKPIQIVTPTLIVTPTIFWTFQLLVALPSGYLFFRWLSKYDSEQNNSDLNSNTETTLAPSPGISQPIYSNQDEIQVVKSVLKTTSRDKEASEINFILTNKFFTVTQRQMKQIWRYLYRPVRQGKATELDLEATINQIGQQGLFLQPVLVPPRVNRTELILLIDQDGSMVPFHGLSQRLVETALGGGRLGNARIYYFHNCPVEYLYRDPHNQEAELVSDIVAHISSKTNVLIFSDAGAARGGYSEERYKLTRDFLRNLKQRVRHMAWLNPMPRKRWLGTTAAQVSHLLPMFEISHKGLQDAISTLRGRRTNFERRQK